MRYDRDNDVEYLLKMDTRDKKRTGIGVFNRASRRGYTGTVRTQVDYLKGKAKKEYMKNGEVRVSSIYDDINNIPSKKDFKSMDYEKGKKILTYIKSRYTSKELAKHWGIANSSVFTLYYKFGVIEKLSHEERLAEKRKKSKKFNKDNAKEVPQQISTVDTKKIESRIDEVEQLKSKMEMITNKLHSLLEKESNIEDGFAISLSGEFSKDFIENRVINIVNTLVDGKKYSVNLKLTELD